MSTISVITSKSFCLGEDPMDLNPIKRNAVMATGMSTGISDYLPLPLPPPLPIVDTDHLNKAMRQDSLLTPTYASSTADHNYANTPVRQKMRFANSPQKSTMKRVSLIFITF